MATQGLVSNVAKQAGVQKSATTRTFNNSGSQIGIQFTRNKRSSQINNYGSQIGQQIGDGAVIHIYNYPPCNIIQSCGK